MILAGLGNPTNQYKNTRHNVGFMFLDWLGGDNEWQDNKNLELLHKKHSFISHTDRIVMDLIKPTTFMNESGRAVSKFLNFYKIQPYKSLIVVFDDLDLDFGNWKIQKEKGPKVHNGVNSIEEKLGTKDFLRIRIGVHNRETRFFDEKNKIPGADYVLQKFTQEELNLLFSKVFPEIKESLGLVVINN